MNKKKKNNIKYEYKVLTKFLRLCYTLYSRSIPQKPTRPGVILLGGRLFWKKNLNR